AVRDGLLLYDHRHGWHGVEKQVQLGAGDDTAAQTAANLAVRDGLLLYDHRHGWHGVEKQVQLGAGDDTAA
ncbi:hypothetical protein C7E18_24265, partial [Stenotrophomonas maltophilia]